MSLLSGPASSSDLVLDGTAYAVLSNAGSLWRMGAANPAWRELLAQSGSRPDQAEQDKLALSGVWVRTVAKPEPLVVMCCGLGSVWPGMGRELYDNYPKAREAMDYLASLAQWNLLGLMDEADPDKINNIRWQIPYLFMLEYAQWHILTSLGLKPDYICGHSLGELIALCFSGVYSVRSAWHLLETRAVHMAQLEESSRSQTGMLAISGEKAVISEVLGAWKSIGVSNANTLRQYILGGPRDDLMAARRFLRQRRIPAFMLNMNLAFHNPAMAVLRDLSYHRLRGLSMKAPEISLWSCVTAKPYPQTQADICASITDLDENTVNWTALVHNLSARANCFLELGPQETLCGLVGENLPDSRCLACDRKNMETLAMRQTCARLFSLGHLPYQAIISQKYSRPAASAETANKPRKAAEKPVAAPVTEDMRVVFELLAESSGRPVAEISQDQDLRYDLALRSSNFPWLVQEAERRLGRSIELENIFEISTVGDLAIFLTGGRRKPERQEQADDKDFIASRAPLRRLLPIPEKGALTLSGAPIDPAARGIAAIGAGLVILCGDLPLKDIWLGLTPICKKLALPKSLKPQCGPLAETDCEIVFFEYQDKYLVQLLAALTAQHGPCQGVILAESEVSASRSICAQICEFIAGISPESWFCQLRKFSSGLLEAFAIENAHISNFLDEAHNLAASMKRLHIAWLDRNESFSPWDGNGVGDMLAYELLHGQNQAVVWSQWAGQETVSQFCPGSPWFTDIWPACQPRLPALRDKFDAECQYSLFCQDNLAAHGKDALWTPASQTAFSHCPWLPPGEMLACMLQAARTLLPWEQISGFSDFHIQQFIPLPEAITRECAITAQLLPWLKTDGVFSRLCRASLNVDKLTANGRHTGIMEPAADVIWLMAKSPSAPRPLWTECCCADALVHTDLDFFYKALNLPADWQLLKAFKINDNISAQTLPKPAVAPNMEFALQNLASPETGVFRMVDAIFQGALFGLAMSAWETAGLPDPEEIAALLSAWKLRGLGYAAFNSDWLKAVMPENAQLQIRLAWREEALIRFDGQISLDSDPIFVLHHMEFDRKA